MKIGSHDSLSYLKPRIWWMRPFHFVARCQSKTYQEQYEAGARYFDVRLRTTIDPNAEPTIAHGIMPFRAKAGFLNEMFGWLDGRSTSDNPIYIRLLYEMPMKDKTKEAEKKEQVFVSLCQKYMEAYPNLRFCGGQRKYDWKLLVSLPPHPCSKDLYSSMTWKEWDDWCPWFYAHFMNKKNWEKYKDVQPNCFALMDFI